VKERGQKKFLMPYISPIKGNEGMKISLTDMGHYRAHTQVKFQTLNVGWGKCLNNFPFCRGQMRRAADLRNCR